MIKESNERITITLSKSQANWLRDFCESKGITTSKYIAYILVRKADELATYLKLEQKDQRELERLIEIARTPIFK